MTDPGDVAVVLLAAGLSRRFGAADKLLAPLAGKPLIQHSLDLLARFAFGERLAVVRDGAPELAGLLSGAGWRLVVNPAPERGKGSSLALGIGAIERMDAALIWLADMPVVPAAHVQALLEKDGPIVASRQDGVNQPPALFRKAHFPTLMECRDDAGPRALMRLAAGIDASSQDLHDVDREEDLHPV
jgi:molybdenum cofactor cytidylyltransferase